MQGLSTNKLVLGTKILSTSGSSLLLDGTVITSSTFIGSGSPEGIVQAISGSLYINWFDQTLYMKLTGDATNAYGWV